MHSAFSQLREILLHEFTEAEVEVLCNKVGISFANLSGTGLFGKTRELLLIAHQQNRLEQLKAHMRAMRPNAFEIDDEDELSVEADEDRPTLEDPPQQHQRSSRDVARETEQVYEVTPQPRTLLPFILITVVAIFSLLIVFLPGLLRGTTETTTTPSPNPPTASTPTTQIPVIEQQSNTNTNNQNSNVNVVVIATPAPFSNTNTESSGAQLVASPTMAETATVNNEDHPAAIAVQRANDVLPAYYRGELDSSILAQQWTDEALKITVAWNDKLPAAIKLKQSARTTLEISYQYIQRPTLISSEARTHKVATTEYWSYSNPAARTQICDAREYIYTVIEADGKFVLTNVTSKLIDKKCQ